MTISIFRRLITIFFSLGIIIGFSDVVRAEDRDVAVTAKKRAQLAKEKMSVIKRPAIPFKRFEMIAPGTGKPILRNEMITLPNGKSISAGNYYEELNRIEKSLNANGHSLRMKENSVQFQRSLVNDQKLQSQRNNIQVMHKKSAPVRIHTEPMVSFKKIKTALVPLQKSVMMKSMSNGGIGASEEIREYAKSRREMKFDEGVINGTITLGVDTPVASALFNQDKSYNFEYGDNSLASAYLDAGLHSWATGQDFDFDAHANAGIYLVGQDFRLLDANAHLSSTPNSNNVDVTLNLAGDSLINFHKSDASSVPLDDHKEKSIDESVGFYVAIGPIPVSVKVGAKGTIGYEPHAHVANRIVHAEFDPFVSVAAYAQAGVDIVIAGAGANASLTLLQDTLTIAGEVGMRGKFYDPITVPGFETYQGQTVRYFNEATRPYVYYWVDITNDITAMSGDISIYAYIYVPCICFDVFEKKEFNYSLVHWDGLHAGGSLFSIDETRYYLTEPLTWKQWAALASAADPQFYEKQKQKLINAARETPSLKNYKPGNNIMHENAIPAADKQKVKVNAANISNIAKNMNASALTMEVGTNRGGSDYSTRDLPTAKACQLACANEAQCKAWTWVQPGVQGQNGKCWLKNSVPLATKSDCCTSGVK